MSDLRTVATSGLEAFREHAALCWCWLQRELAGLNTQLLLHVAPGCEHEQLYIVCSRWLLGKAVELGAYGRGQASIIYPLLLDFVRKHPWPIVTALTNIVLMRSYYKNKTLLRNVRSELTQCRSELTQCRIDLARGAFARSLADTYPHLRYDVVDVRQVQGSPALKTLECEYHNFIKNELVNCIPKEREERYVFHTANAANLDAIEQEGLRPSMCPECRGLPPGTAARCRDAGWFGNHTKGVYVSKHADYTFFYQHGRTPQPGDSGSVLLLKAVTGKVYHMHQESSGIPPTAGYHCHESPKYLEYFLCDRFTVGEPPRATCRAIPLYVISWRAERKQRGGVEHDQ